MFGTPRYPITYTGAVDDVKYLGRECYFDNLASYAASTDALFTYGAPWCKARWVINKSSGTLAKGVRVLHNNDASYVPGIAVAGVAGADVRFAGFVSPWIDQTTVADGEGFWLITEGFCEVTYDGSANLALRDYIAGAASGHCEEAAADYTEYTIGCVVEAKTSGSAGDLFWAFVKLPWG